MAKWQRLNRRWQRRDGIRHQWCRLYLLCVGGQGRHECEQQHAQQRSRAVWSVPGHTFVLLTPATAAAMLLPWSARITLAALRPGWPVTEPPGAVHEPVWYSPGMGIR